MELHDKSWDQAQVWLWLLLFSAQTSELSTVEPSTVGINNLLSEIDSTVKILASQIKNPHHYKVK